MDAEKVIEAAWEHRATISPGAELGEVRAAVNETIARLDRGEIRVAQKVGGQWVVHQWIKKAVLLSFRLHDNQVMETGGYARFFDKVPTKFADYSEGDFVAGGFRVVPPATVRRGAYIARNAVLMPSYVNIGAYVDEGTMVDTWATVGSCAQIGKNVHLSGGVGIGGVLEPLQSTKIFNRETGEVTYGRVPAGSVVVAGSLPSNGCNLYCAVIVKQVDAKTRAKTSINELLRA
jgi:2,3,4,5-tetrahydropyridine-2-carboxylate N-succinyltransferase